MTISTKFDTRTVLVLSTSHIEQSTSEWLEGEAAAEENATSIDVASSIYGFWMYVHDEWEVDQYPADLCRVFEFCKEHGFSYLCLDRDGDTVDGLPVFHW